MSEESVDEQIEALRTELLLAGFAVVKEIARLRNQMYGTMKCPLCQQVLMFYAAVNGHMTAACITDGCIHATE